MISNVVVQIAEETPRHAPEWAKKRHSGGDVWLYGLIDRYSEVLRLDSAERYHHMNSVEAYIAQDMNVWWVHLWDAKEGKFYNAKEGEHSRLLGMKKAEYLLARLSQNPKSVGEAHQPRGYSAGAEFAHYSTDELEGKSND